MSSGQVTDGKKHDGGKDPWHLLPFDALRAITQVLAFGANKYTKTGLGSLWDAIKPDALDLVTAKGSVVRITKSNSGVITLSSQNVSDRIDVNGQSEILKECRTWLDVERHVRSLGYEMQLPKDGSCLKDLAPPQNASTSSYEEAVKFAEASNTFTLITTTTQGSSEAFCVVSTTTGWASLATTLRVLKPHFATSELLQHKTGERGWEEGMEWSRCFSALQRHLAAWWMREGADPDTGYSHLWHAGCCIMFLIAYEIRGIGQDDRPEGS